MRALVDLLYGVGTATRRFRKANPDEPVLAARACKATRSDAPRAAERGAHWIGARRGTLLVTAQRLSIAGWVLPFDIVREARVLRFRQLGSDGALLVLGLDDGSEVQIGFQDPEPVLDALPFDVSPYDGSLGMSPFSRLLRVGLLVAIGVYVYQRYFA
ncbi:MAG: hypothetical protein EP330_07335 [Deltaproteobacteria bacterium]|nr:MAG: hypothetical protein EP330_07335 [Deltaproteobacteria bacterium]